MANVRYIKSPKNFEQALDTINYEEKKIKTGVSDEYKAYLKQIKGVYTEARSLLKREPVRFWSAFGVALSALGFGVYWYRRNHQTAKSLMEVAHV